MDGFSVSCVTNPIVSGGYPTRFVRVAGRWFNASQIAADDWSVGRQSVAHERARTMTIRPLPLLALHAGASALVLALAGPALGPQRRKQAQDGTRFCAGSLDLACCPRSHLGFD